METDSAPSMVWAFLEPSSGRIVALIDTAASDAAQALWQAGYSREYTHQGLYRVGEPMPIFHE